MVVSSFHQAPGTVTRGSLFVPALEMEFWDFLRKDLWGVLGFSRLIPHPCQKDFCSVLAFPLKKKRKVRTQKPSRVSTFLLSQALM